MVMLAHHLVEARRGDAHPRGRRREPSDRSERGTRRSRCWLRSATPSTRCRSERPFRRITGSSRRATCTSTASLRPDLAELAVLMRRTRRATGRPVPRARSRVADVLTSRPIAAPLKFLDCCPVSDGGCAFVVNASERFRAGVRIVGAAQAHTRSMSAPHQPWRSSGRGIVSGAPSAAGVSLDESLCRDLRQLHHHPGDPA